MSLWEGYHESRRCSRDTYPESYITKYEDDLGEVLFVEDDHLEGRHQRRQLREERELL